MFWNYFLLLFIKGVFSTTPKLVRLSAIDITQKLEKSPKSIVFVSDDDDLLKFAYPVIEKYKEQIQFFLTSPDEVPSSFYTTLPAIIPFQYTKALKIDTPPLESKSFSYWVERIIDPTHYNVAFPAQLEKILEGPVPALFEVDGGSNENKIEKELTIFKSSSSLFQKFNIKIQPGLYVYRPQDKQMIPYNGSFALQSFSRLTHFSLIDQNSNKIIIAFVIDEWGEKSKEQYDILENLSYIYGCEKYYYTLLDPLKIQKLLKGIGIHGIKRPVFIISNISSYPSKKWIYNSTLEGNADFESLKKFVSEVASDHKEPTIISDPVPIYNKTNPSSILPIVNSNFGDFVYDDTCETVVLFQQDGNMKCTLFLPFYKAVAKLLDNKYTKFYTFDITTNDIPPEVPEITSYPMVLMWPAGKKDEPKIFSGDFNLQSTIDFIKEFSSHKFAVPTFDTKQVLRSINEKINNLLKKDKIEESKEL